VYFEKSDTVKSLKLFEYMFNVIYFTHFSQLSNSEKSFKNLSAIDKVTTGNVIAYFLDHPAHACLLQHHVQSEQSAMYD
jgi:hypothetical protein